MICGYEQEMRGLKNKLAQATRIGGLLVGRAFGHRLDDPGFISSLCVTLLFLLQ